MEGYCTILAGIYAPITAFTLGFVNDYCAGFFSLSDCVFGASKNAWGVDATFAGYRRILDLPNPNRANPRLKRVEDLLFFKGAGILADVTSNAFVIVAVDMLVEHV